MQSQNKVFLFRCFKLLFVFIFEFLVKQKGSIENFPAQKFKKTARVAPLRQQFGFFFFLSEVCGNAFNQIKNAQKMTQFDAAKK